MQSPPSLTHLLPPQARRLLQAVMPPHRPELPAERRRRAMLVSILALCGGPVTGVILLLVLGIWPHVSSWPALLTVGGLLLAWGISRAGKDAAAAWALCWAAFVGPCAGLLLNPTHVLDFQLYSLFLPAFLASVLLSPGGAVLLTAAAELLLLTAPVLVPSADVMALRSAAIFGLAVAPVTVLSAMLIRRDLFQLHAQARELTLARDAALASSDAKSRFLARAGHELRTPLTSALGFTDLVLESLRSGGDARLLADVERTRRSLEMLRGMVEGILTLSRIDLGRLPVKTARVDCCVLAEDCADLIRVQAAGSGNAVVATRTGEPPWIVTDATKLTQVLLNLLTNAVRATTNGTITVDVCADAARAGGVVVSVTDTGVGMTAEETARVFEEFWQSDSQIRSARGMGLGLSICEQLCTLIKADISVVSQRNKGTTFSLALPPAVEDVPAGA